MSNIRTSFIIILFSILHFSGTAQYDIKIDIKGYDNDTLIIGNYFAEKQLVVDTLISSGKRNFTLKGDKKLKPGMYLALLFPSRNFVQFFVPVEDQTFELKVDMEDLSKVKFKGSDTNSRFYDYLAYLTNKKSEADVLNKKIEDAKNVDKEDEQSQLALDKLDKEVKNYQQQLIDAHPDDLFTKLLKSNVGEDIPEFEGTEEEQKLKQYLWYKKHYFDNIDLGDSVNLRMPYLHQRIDFYMEKLTPVHPDSIIQSIDYLLTRMEPAQETFRYYLSYFYNSIVKKRIIGMDAVTVHLVDEYYSKGKAPWLDEENMLKIQENADFIRPTLIGKKAQNIILYQEDGTPWELYQDSSEYLVMIFWAPECGHCSKAMPKYLEFNEKYKSSGIKMVSICTKTGSKYEDCWKGVKEKNMEGLLNLGDQYLKSKYKTKYDVRQTPKLFILDRNKEIILKDVPAENLEQLMDEVIKSKMKEAVNE